MPNTKKWVCLILAIVFSAAITWGLRRNFEQKEIYISFNVNSPEVTDFQLFWKNSNTAFTEKASIHKNNKQINRNENLEFKIPAGHVDEIRFDLGNKADTRTYAISSFKINGKDISLKREETEFFTHNVKADVQGHYRVVGNDPYIIFRGGDISTDSIIHYDYFLGLSLFVISFFILSALFYKFAGNYWGSGLTRHLNYIFICLTLVLIVAPLLTMHPSLRVSKEENRTLAPKPGLKVNGMINSDYGRQFESWFNDRFGGRQYFIRIHDRVESILRWNSYENNRAFSGKGNWLFYKGDDSGKLFQNEKMFTDDQISHINDNLHKEKNWLQSHGIGYYVFIAPNKADVYGEYYKSGIHKRAGADRVEVLESKLSGEVPVVYPLAQLKENKGKGLIYWKNDTHWSELGAYYGYLALMEPIRKVYTDIPLLTSEEMQFTEVSHERGDLSGMLGINDKHLFHEKYFKPVPLNGYHFKEIEVKKRPNGNEEFIRTINSSAKYKVIVFRDSFSSNLLPYLSESFGEVIYIWDHNMNKYTELIEKEKPDIVIHEMVSRYADSLLMDTPNWKEGE